MVRREATNVEVAVDEGLEDARGYPAGRRRAQFGVWGRLVERSGAPEMSAPPASATPVWASHRRDRVQDFHPRNDARPSETATFAQKKVLLSQSGVGFGPQGNRS